MTLCEQIEIDDRTRMIVGQELDMVAGQPDVCNVIVHRAGDLLVLVDSGVTSVFRDAIRSAADDLAPWSNILLLTTHGHPDHVGNNDLIAELGDGIDRANVHHFVSAHDAVQYRDHGISYWITSLGRVSGLVPGFEDPSAAARQLLAMYRPYVPVTDITRTYEELPLEHLVIGSQHVSGWSFGDGAVQVIRTQGHCAGQVVVHLPEARLLHLSDEPNGPCGAMHDANQMNIFAAIAQALTLVETGAVDVVTEGHAFEVFDRRTAVERLSTLLDQAAALDGAAQELLAGGIDDLPAFVEAFIARSQELGASGANPNPMFNTMMTIAKLRDLGLVVEGEGSQQTWSRPVLGDTPRAP
ncbi:MBL fold metallo-hydrolase [Rhodococcus sp. 4CII]|uniref:MBL fold metallo-hydrolase n=1 Tax=Rhodococcus sp. 4CII TaxID=2834580 RepID=UPI00163DD57E|nr:MBL fold metallo-hydrolase [Rhodococcus sp. 4CII]MBC2893280.1 MBL fold metallo-hydrolase [Rhodococcus sp. 4CII]